MSIDSVDMEDAQIVYHLDEFVGTVHVAHHFWGFPLWEATNYCGAIRHCTTRDEAVSWVMYGTT